MPAYTRGFRIALIWKMVKHVQRDGLTVCVCVCVCLGVRKSVRAALVLLPLLGITNSFNIMVSPVQRSPLEFGLWSYSTTFLRSCQGLFVCCIYCFFNDEVGRQCNECCDGAIWNVRENSFGPRDHHSIPSIQLKAMNRLMYLRIYVESSSFLALESSAAHIRSVEGGFTMLVLPRGPRVFPHRLTTQGP